MNKLLTKENWQLYYGLASIFIEKRGCPKSCQWLKMGHPIKVVSNLFNFSKLERIENGKHQNG